MKITNVEAIILRQPEMDVSKADGSQDALLIRIETDAGITGFGEVDSLPSVVKAIVEAPPSHAIASGLRHLLIGENPLEIDRLWHKLYRGSIYYGRQGPAIHALSGIDIALRGINGKASGQPIGAHVHRPRRRHLAPAGRDAGRSGAGRAGIFARAVPLTRAHQFSSLVSDHSAGKRQGKAFQRRALPAPPLSSTREGLSMGV